jgi:hypothetical protein
MRRSIVTRIAASLVLCGLVACGDRPSSQPATSTAQPQATPQRPALTGEELTRRTIERRAIEAINWGMPAVNEDLMLQAMIVSAKGRTNQIAYWSRLPDWKIQTLTPNPDVIYLKPFFNTKDAGPMVLEIPPADGGSITGTIMDAWQAALEDVGPAGVDKGKGGKYLILPPDYKGKAPAGYIVLPSMTYQGYALLRSILASGSETDVAKAVEYAKRIKLYPLSQAGNPPATTFVDAIDVVYDATIPYDVRFFESLNRVVQIEPWLTRDKVMIDLLKALDGGKTYRLHVPAKAPVSQYWSATLYDRATHALIRDVSRPSRSSQSPGLQTNADGSVDLYFGPAAPSGRETNWVPTRAGGQFEVLFRLYGPDKTFFDKAWQLPDIEEAK